MVEPPVATQAFSRAFGGDAGAARGEGGLAGEGGREVVGDGVPGLAVEGADVGEDAVDGVRVGDAAIGGPEGEAVVEGVDGVVGELDRPVGAGVFGFVDAEVGGVVADAHEVGDAVADALDVAELEASAPGTTPACQVLPPSLVWVKVPPAPEAQTTRALTGLTAMSSWVVPLFCGVRVGWWGFAYVVLGVDEGGGGGD